MVSGYTHAVRRFDRNVRLYLFTAGVIGFTAWGGIYPTIFNLYLLRMGYGPEAIGAVNAAGNLAFALSCIPAGWLIARLGSRRVILIGLVCTGLAQALLPQAGLVPPDARLAYLVGCNVFGTFGLALYAVSSGPFVMAAAPDDLRGYAFSIQVAIWPLAAFAGSLLAGALPAIIAGALGLSLDTPAPYRVPLMLASVMYIPAFLAMLATRETRPDFELAPLGGVGRFPVIPILFIAVVLFLQGSGEAAARTFFNVYLDEGLSASAAQIGLLTALGQLLAAPAALLTPSLTGRLGQPRAYALTSLGIAASLLPLALVPRLGAAGIGFAGAISMISVARAAMLVYQFGQVAPRWRAAMGAGGTLAVGLSGAIVAWAGGQIIAQAGFQTLFLGAAVVTALGVLLFVALRGRVERMAAGQ